MKATITAVLLTAILVFFAVPNRSFAQAASDTMVVSALNANGQPNLDNAIMGDTTSTGQRADPNRVYVLQQTGNNDTTYFFSTTLLVNYNLTIVGKPNPVTGRLPVVEPAIRADNSSAVDFAKINSGSITLKDLYFLGWRTDTTTSMNRIVVVNGDSVRAVMDHCVVDAMTGHVFNVNASHCKFFITNSEFRDIVNLGALWVGGALPLDTLEFVNNTFFDVQFEDFGDLGYVGYLDFDHNTCFLGCTIPLNIPEMTNGVIENNIFYGLASSGTDSAMLRISPTAYGWTLFYLDSLHTLKGAPSNLTEANRNIAFKNNAYYWPKGIYDYWAAVRDTTHIPGLITPPYFMEPQTARMFSDHTGWPHLVAANNDSVDPAFSSSLVTPAVDSLVKYINLLWTKGTAGGFRPMPLYTDPMNVYAGVPQNWASTQGYPVPENLAYSNGALQSAGTDGFALGDLNWYPAQMKLWEEGKVNAVESTGPQVPAKFDLSQNYPNPFNPSTDIKVSLKQAGVMSLTVYNVLGQVVDVVAQGYKPAGEYTYNVNMNRFASGVYFYSLRQGSNVMTKKMLLLK